MRVHPIIALGCLALGTVSVFLILATLQRKPDSISISIRDGNGLTGAEILNSAYILSSELPVEIVFYGSDGDAAAITAISRKTVSNFMGDWMSLEVRPNEIRMNEEVLSDGELKSRFLSYAESARLTESLPFFLVAARDESTGVRLVAVLKMLRDSGISNIIPTYTTEAANTTADSTAFRRESP